MQTAMLASEHAPGPEKLSAQNKICHREQDYRQYLDRFTEAVGRSKHWVEKY